jgi:hypothetical protein
LLILGPQDVAVQVFPMNKDARPITRPRKAAGGAKVVDPLPCGADVGRRLIDGQPIARGSQGFAQMASHARGDLVEHVGGKGRN